MNNDTFPLLSVITINLNNATGLARTVDSFRPLRMESDWIEFLFVDGGSRDHSLDIATSFYKPEDMFVGPDKGIYDAMNKGLFHSHGRFCIWINSGDEACKLEVWRQLPRILQGPEEIDIACFGVNVFDETKGTHIITFLPDIKELDLLGGTLPHPGAIFRSEALKRIGGYTTRYRIVSDRDALLQLKAGGAKILTLTASIANFYSGGISESKARVYENMHCDMKHGMTTRLTYWYRAVRYWKGMQKMRVIAFLKRCTSNQFS